MVEVPASRLLPAGWDNDADAVSLTYRHPKIRGNVQFTLTCVALGDRVAVHLNKTDSELTMMEVEVSEFIQVDHIGDVGNLFTNLEVCV